MFQARHFENFVKSLSEYVWLIPLMLYQFPLHTVKVQVLHMMFTRLTLNCIRYPALPLVHKGGSMEPPKKTTFPPEFFNYLYPMYIYTNRNHISGEKNKRYVLFQNGGQITDFHFATFRFWPKFENHFPEGIFQWNLAQIRRSWIH